jgi:curved DNA-binding protein CbpA
LNLEAHYRVLGIAPGSPFALVKKTYLREIKTWHPDRYAPNSSLREMAEERTKALTAAYAALRAAGDNGDGATSGAMGRPPSSAPAPHDRTSGRQWFEWFRQYLRARRQIRAEATGPATADQRFAKSAVGGRAGGRVKLRKAPTFNQVLDEARGQSRSPSDITTAWRRLAAKHSRYRRQGGNSGITPIDPISPRRPVTPVRPIRPIGEDD